MPQAKLKKRADGRYQSSVFLGYTPEGKVKKRYVYGKGPKEVAEKILKIKMDISMGRYIDQNISVKQWSEKWISGKAGKSIRTQKMYSDILKRYIVPAIGKVYLNDIKIFHVQDLLSGLFDRPRTCQMVRMTLSQMFKKAVLSELMHSNPADQGNVDMPTKRSPRKRVVTDIELEALRKANLTEKERAFVILCLYCGLRKSEALAIIPGDIADGKLTVRRSVQDDGSISNYGKSNTSYRIIPLPEHARTFLEAFKRSTSCLITCTSGKPLNSNQYARMWDRIKYKANKAIGGTCHMSKSKKYMLDIAVIGTDLSAHILRHTYATNLGKAGYSPAEIMYLMGHATAALALEIYTHIQKDLITADKLNENSDSMDVKWMSKPEIEKAE